jgi:hypothetical protein
MLKLHELLDELSAVHQHQALIEVWLDVRRLGNLQREV